MRYFQENFPGHVIFERQQLCSPRRLRQEALERYQGPAGPERPFQDDRRRLPRVVSGHAVAQCAAHGARAARPPRACHATLARGALHLDRQLRVHWVYLASQACPQRRQMRQLGVHAKRNERILLFSGSSPRLSHKPMDQPLNSNIRSLHRNWSVCVCEGRDRPLSSRCPCGAGGRLDS